VKRRVSLALLVTLAGGSLGWFLLLPPSRADALAQESPARSSPGPRGPIVEASLPPAGAGAWPRVCSARHPVCVHAMPVTPPARELAALDSAERAWETLTGALELPPPDGDLDGAWHVYLVDDVEGGGRAFLQGKDPRARFDRATSFGLVDGAQRGCSLDLALARAVARGSLWRVAPAVDEGSAAGQSEAIARLAAICASGDEDTLAFQLRPDRAIVDPVSTAFDRGASLFFGWLDDTFGASPGTFIEGLWALSPTHTPPDSWRWAGAPTPFDVMRVSLRGSLRSGSTIDDVFVRFAVDRASMDPRPRDSWHVPWPVHARRLAAPEPLAPTGTTLVRVDVAGAPPGAKLHVEAEWEDYARMRWVVAKLDASGKVLAQIPIGSTDRSTIAAVTVENLGSVNQVLVVGVNVGSTEYAFDPDQGEWEPHGWLLTLGGE
jgi:hypothetical protein